MNSEDGSPRRDPKSERIEAILAAALAEFVEQGFAATRLDSIAERAGIGKGTVYLYFDSKEALFEEAVRNVIVPIIEHVEEMAFAPDGSAEELLRNMLRTFYTEVVGTERRRVIRLLIAEGPRFPELLSFYYREVVDRGLGALRMVVEYGVKRGEFEKSPAADYPQILLAPAMVGAIWKMLFDRFEEIDLEAFCDAHLDLLRNGLKANLT